MFTSQQYRTKALEFSARQESARTPAEIKEYRALEQSYASHADNLDWMAANTGRTISNSARTPRRPETLVDHPLPDLLVDPPPDSEEDNMLRCLGAAVILNWDTIPTKLQRSLFDDASSLKDVPDTPSRGDLARFLHNGGRTPAGSHNS